MSLIVYNIVIFPLYLTLLRLIAPLLILKLPLPGILLSIFLDMSDWDLINFQTDHDYIIYQYWDKAFDLYFLSLAALTLKNWSNGLPKKIASALFIYRALGTLLFFIIGDRQILLFFPNFFEVFFVFCLFANLLFKKISITIPILVILFFPKILHEFFLHLLLKQPWEIIHFINLETADKLIWFSLLYLLPLLLCLYLAQPKKR